MFIDPIIRYKIDKKTNKIQWRCVETPESMKNHIFEKSLDYTCKLSYRTLPSELNTFIKIFGYNPWLDVEHVFGVIKVQKKEDFIKYIDRFKTIGDIEDFINKQKGVI